ncbi:MAG: type II toxin-antitoxin system prevent-host-death family antitoxin [Acidobacteria bacterium]|nr:type II toxin-antitoxin system prevent-host-death family antitoxin [Acidobacteriota bacterium]MBK8149526.1 type II toxin-antitoxin system prevent-host-death family antitoxin [Acidobacteriota bacterium]MBK8813724.1 type II toxin-antitoxin system prevent-host-death family antitoxin [Acidobacteriota bacterium]
MRTANIAELKNNLSSYLADVKLGEEIVISDRNRPFAKIIPLQNADDFSSEELALAAAGILRLPEIDAIPDSFFSAKMPKLSAKKAVQAILEERDED